METINISVSVAIDLTPRFEAVLRSLVCEPRAEAAKAVSPSLTDAKPAPVAVSEPAAPVVVSEPAPVAVSEPAKSSEYTDADLRSAMNSCRERIIGNGPDPLLKQAVNDALRGKVGEMGYKASTDIPQERRREFVLFCENLTMPAPGDGELPF